MRRLTANEEKITSIISTGNADSLSSLLDPHLKGVRITISAQHQVQLLFETQNPVPNAVETQRILDTIRELSVEIVTVVSLIHLLENGGYIVLYQPANITYPITFGQGAFNLPSTSVGFFDRKISDLLFDYVSKDIIVTPELSRFVDKGFIAREEQRFKTQVLISTIAIAVALFAALTNFFFNLSNKLAGGTKIRQDQVEILKKEMHATQDRLDTLILVTRQSTTEILQKLPPVNSNPTRKKVKRN